MPPGSFHRCCFRSVAVVRECRAGSRRAWRLLPGLRSVPGIRARLGSAAHRPRRLAGWLPVPRRSGQVAVRRRDVPCLSHRSSHRLRTRVYVQTRARGRDGTTGGTITHGDRSPFVICPLTRCRSGWLLQEVATGSPPPDGRPPPPGPWRRPAQRRTRTRPAGGTVPSGRSDQARYDPGAPGCLPGLRPPLPRFGLAGGGVRPGRSLADGATEELPLLRPRRRCSSWTSSANATRSDRSSPIAAACSAITASRAAHDAQPGSGGQTSHNWPSSPPATGSQAATPGQPWERPHRGQFPHVTSPNPSNRREELNVYRNGP